MTATPPLRSLRPRKGTFMFPRIWPVALIFFILCGGAAGGLVASGEATLAAIPGGLFVVVVGLATLSAAVAYRKEGYEFHERRFICRRGGLTSDQVTELEAKNITHVKLRLPWLRYKFFGVGDVIVESAGSSDAEIRIRSVQDPEEVYEFVRGLMQKNGFSLQRQKLLHEESPDFVGAAVECLGLAATAFLGLVIGIGQIVAEANIEIDSPGVQYAILGLTALLLPGGLFGLTVHYLDLRRRKYRVYDDAIVYEEGFLTRDNAFIPYENIADASTRRTFVDQIVGLYDVAVSCQGTGQEIKFRRLRRGPELAKAIDDVVERSEKEARAKADKKARERAEAGESVAQTRARGPAPGVDPSKAWTAELRMSLVRGILPILFLAPAVPVFIMALIAVVIRAATTRYSIRPSSVKSSFKFLSTVEREFGYDKITGVVVTESLWDKLMNTISVRLWSIGAGEPITLTHVKRDEVDLEALLNQAGIPSTEPIDEAPTAFGLGAFIRRFLPGMIFVALYTAGIGAIAALADPMAVIGLILPLSILGIGLVYSFLYYPKQRLLFHEHHVEQRSGLIIKRRFYAEYSKIKKVVLTRYPGGDTGAVQIFVAGEHHAGKQQQGIPGAAGGKANKGMLIPYSFTAHYIEGIDQLSRSIDAAVEGVLPTAEALRGVPAEEAELTAAPALGNTLFGLIAVSLILVPLAALLPFTLPYAIIAVRRRRYSLESRRVKFTYGILYRGQATVLYDRIDSLKHNQGLVNKMFGNANITLYTAGSSRPDLELKHLKDHRGFYDAIRARYGSES